MHGEPYLCACLCLPGTLHKLGWRLSPERLAAATSARIHTLSWLAVAAQARIEDPLRSLADALRAKGGVEWRSAVMADQRVEFIRGKDLAAHMRAHPEQIQPHVSKCASLGLDCIMVAWLRSCASVQLHAAARATLRGKAVTWLLFRLGVKAAV